MNSHIRILWVEITLCALFISNFVILSPLYAQTKYDSALKDYVNIYNKYLHRGEGGGNCAMYPSCSKYGLHVFSDCYFPKAMMYMADRMIRCGHDFNSYDLTLQNGQLRYLDFPAYVKDYQKYIYRNAEYYAFINNRERKDSTSLFIQSLINRQLFQEALLEIERAQFFHCSDPLFLSANKLRCYKGLGQFENAIYEYEIRFDKKTKAEPQIKFEILEVLLKVENYNMANKLLSEISDQNNTPNVLAKKYIWAGLIEAGQCRWEAADYNFKISSRFNSNLKRNQTNNQLIQEALSIKAKKPWLASTLSIIPGLGYIYTDRPKSAVTAFIMNSLLAYAVVSSIKEENYGVASLLGVFNLSFYFGNMFGAKRSAEQYNRKKIQKIQNNLFYNNQDLIKS